MHDFTIAIPGNWRKIALGKKFNSCLILSQFTSYYHFIFCMNLDLKVDSLVTLTKYATTDMFQISINNEIYEVTTPFALEFSKKIANSYSIDKTIKKYEFTINFDNEQINTILKELTSKGEYHGEISVEIIPSLFNVFYEIENDSITSFLKDLIFGKGADYLNKNHNFLKPIYKFTIKENVLHMLAENFYLFNDDVLIDIMKILGLKQCIKIFEDKDFHIICEDNLCSFLSQLIEAENSFVNLAKYIYWGFVNRDIATKFISKMNVLIPKMEFEQKMFIELFVDLIKNNKIVPASSYPRKNIIVKDILNGHRIRARDRVGFSCQKSIIPISYSVIQKSKLNYKIMTGWYLKGSNDNGKTMTDIDVRDDVLPGLEYELNQTASYKSYYIYIKNSGKIEGGYGYEVNYDEIYLVLNGIIISK